MQEGRASRTALMVAARRAAHQLMDRPLVFEDPLAIRILPRELSSRLETDPRFRSRWGRFMRAALSVRSRLAEDELKQAVDRGVRQYVLLGAGFDTFAYRNPFPNLRVFEVDHPDTQLVKRHCLQAAAIAIPETTTFVPIDFTKTALADALTSAGFDANQPSCFAWLGVVPYLELDAIEATLRYIGARPAGTTLVFDYGASPRTLGWLERFLVWRVQRRLKRIGEPWKTFFTAPQAEALLKRCGFSLVQDFGAEQLNRLYLAHRTDGLRIGRSMRMAKGIV